MIVLILVLLVILISPSRAFSAERQPPLQLSWTNNMLTISAPWIPGEKVEVWHMEAFCRPCSSKLDWHETTVPH